MLTKRPLGPLFAVLACLLVLAASPVRSQGARVLETQMTEVERPAVTLAELGGSSTGAALAHPNPGSGSLVSLAGNFIWGIGMGAVNMVGGTINAFRHPGDTLAGLGHAIAHPGSVVDALGRWRSELADAWKNDPSKAARMLGEATFNVGMTGLAGYGLARGAIGVARAVRGVGTAGTVGRTAAAADAAAEVGTLSRPTITGFTPRYGIQPVRTGFTPRPGGLPPTVTGYTPRPAFLPPR